MSFADLTTATGKLAIEAYASWTIDGGGKSDTAKLSKVCHEPPPTSEEPPIEVGGVQAERPTAPASAESAAAVAVTADPRFTG